MSTIFDGARMLEDEFLTHVKAHSMMIILVMQQWYSAVFAIAEGVTWEEMLLGLEIQGTEFLVAINCPGNVIDQGVNMDIFHPSACRTVREVTEKMH